MRIVNITTRLAALSAATFLLWPPEGYGQKFGRSGGGGQGDGQGQSQSVASPGGGGGGSRSGDARSGRSTNAPTGGGISNPVGGALSRQSLNGSASANSGRSNSVRSSDNNGNRASASQDAASQFRGRSSRDGAGVQPIIRPNTSAPPTGAPNASAAGAAGASTSISNSGAAAAASSATTRTEAGRREQQSFFRGPTDRINDRDNFGNRRDRNDNNDDRNNLVDRDRDRDRDRDNFARNRDNRNFDGRDRDGRDRFDNNNDWSRIGRAATRNFAARSGALPFSYGWYNNYPGGRRPAYSPFGYSRWQNQPNYWWGYTPANRLTSYFAFGWNRPRYWTYGSGGNIYYQDDYVYYDGNRYQPISDYYQRMYDLAHSAPAIDPSQAEGMDWAPLGVFVAARNATDNAAEERTIQLAVNKDGVIVGTYFNPRTDKAQALVGMVDSHSQRAAWTFADDEHKGTIFETSVFNLTKPESTVMVHYGPKSDQTEVWHLVRLEQPDTANVNANPQAATGRDLP